MLNVKRVFFFENDEEAEAVRKKTGDRYIMTHMPHYELENGEIVYSCGGASDFAMDVIVRPAVDGAKSGYGNV